MVNPMLFAGRQIASPKNLVPAPAPAGQTAEFARRVRGLATSGRCVALRAGLGGLGRGGGLRVTWLVTAACALRLAMLVTKARPLAVGGRSALETDGGAPVARRS